MTISTEARGLLLNSYRLLMCVVLSGILFGCDRPGDGAPVEAPSVATPAPDRDTTKDSADPDPDWFATADPEDASGPDWDLTITPSISDSGRVTTAPPDTIELHAWSYLREFGSEPEGYASYSYVLVGRTDLESPAVRRFHALIKAIQGSTSTRSEVADVNPEGLTNLILIPAQIEEDFPDQHLAKTYVSALEASHPRLRKPGPFFVVVYEPLSRLTVDDPVMLLVDLSQVHEAAFTEFSHAVKLRLSDGPIDEMEVLRSLKASLLSLVFITNDALLFAPVAYAEFREIFDPE